ncbi:Hypothetical protein D9617_1g081040 [Elsinoe fawcettii]|nr:Hypothetical protein D9617_1g081040 [Elsinoe fawcettii]
MAVALLGALLPLVLAVRAITLAPRVPQQQQPIPTTCGFVNGDANFPVQCTSDYSCSTTRQRVSSTQYNYLACCDVADCATPPALCANYNPVSPWCSATGSVGCTVTGNDDLLTLACPSAAPQCLTQIAPLTGLEAYAFACATASAAQFATIYPSTTSADFRPTNSIPRTTVPFPSPTSLSGSVAIPTVPSSLPSQATASPSATDVVQGGSGPSTSVIAAIVVVGVVILAALTGIWFFWRRRHPRAKKEGKKPLDAVPGYVSEMQGMEVASARPSGPSGPSSAIGSGTGSGPNSGIGSGAGSMFGSEGRDARGSWGDVRSEQGGRGEEGVPMLGGKR